MNVSRCLYCGSPHSSTSAFLSLVVYLVTYDGGCMTSWFPTLRGGLRARTCMHPSALKWLCVNTLILTALKYLHVSTQQTHQMLMLIAPHSHWRTVGKWAAAVLAQQRERIIWQLREHLSSKWEDFWHVTDSEACVSATQADSHTVVTLFVHDNPAVCRVVFLTTQT